MLQTPPRSDGECRGQAAVLCGEARRAPLSHTSALRARVIARVIAQLDRRIAASRQHLKSTALQWTTSSNASPAPCTARATSCLMAATAFLVRSVIELLASIYEGRRRTPSETSKREVM